jgi:hypothetical protein
MQIWCQRQVSTGNLWVYCFNILKLNVIFLLAITYIAAGKYEFSQELQS